ncbi:MAG: cation:proton antiporter [Chloroflexota bacterium]
MIIYHLLQIFVTWLIIANLVGILVKKLRMPYTVGLVVAGMLLAIIGPYLRSQAQVISPEDIRTLLIPNLILALFVPPLVFEAAFHIKLKELRSELGKILAFAIPGVILTMLLVGTALAWIPELSWPAALVFGALISATDPVAVVALFRSLGAPKRLVLLLEGESLFNDGTAIVLFHMMLAIAATGEVHLIKSLFDFFRVALGGLLIGWGAGTLAAFLISRVKDDFIQISFSLIAAYGAYLVSEHFHLSGVLAVVAAGLICGNASSTALAEDTRKRLLEFWDYAAFLANTFVFLIIGLVIDFRAILDNLGYSLLAIAAVLISRAIVIYGLSRLAKGIPLNFQHILNWGGLRGAVSLALALSLTHEEVGSSLGLLQAMAFSIVLFTLLVQGTSMASLLKRCNLIQPTTGTEAPPTEAPT